jgi:hypothetical protein
MRSGQRVDFMMYLRALPLLARHPSILAMPLLAGVVDLLVSSISQTFTDPLGGLGNSLFQFIVQIIYGFAFGVATIQASNIWRGFRGSFDEAWVEGKHRAGGIILAVIGFYFVLFVAQYAGSLLGSGMLAIVLTVVAAFFLIYTVPAAAIGGLPGSLAITGSIRSARANVPGTIVLAVVFYALFYLVPAYVINPFALTLGLTGYKLAIAAVRAIAFAYLAFPFAKQYDDVAFRL